MKRERKINLLPQIIETMVSDGADVYLLFVDLCGSTQYKQELIRLNVPDLTWIFRQLIFLQRTSDIVKSYNGVVVKTIGDELFAYFDISTHPEDILKCSIEIIQSFDNLNSYKGNSKIEVKASMDIGLTYNGSILNTVPYDPIGSAVDRCARLNNECPKGEIYFSEDYFTAITQIISEPLFKRKYNYNTHTKELKGLGNTTYYSITAK